MQINFQGKNMEVTDAIRDYVSKRITNLEKLISSIEVAKGEATVNFEVKKTTNHHKAGPVFQASGMIKIDGRKYYGKVNSEDLYSAIDEVKESLFREITKNKDRQQTLFKRGAASVKKMLKGLSKRNPFTSKY